VSEGKSFAADGKTKIINIPGHPLLVSAVDFNKLYAEHINSHGFVADGAVQLTVKTQYGAVSIVESRVIARAELNKALMRRQVVSDQANSMVDNVLASRNRLKSEQKGSKNTI
jgi:hypothetical protein